MLAFSLSQSVASQRGLADAREATDIGVYMLVGVALGAAYAVAAWFAQPALTITEPMPALARPRTLSAGQSAAFVTTTRMKPAGTLTILGAIVLLVALSLTLTIVGSSGIWVLWSVTAAMILLSASMLVFRVRVDEAGLSVRSALGVPRFRIPLDEVATARAIEVNAMADFGGWGVRFMPGNGTGVIVSSGQALQVERGNGKKFTVTVSDAARAADLLLGLRDRRRA